jgi:hypothetical protein
MHGMISGGLVGLLDEMHVFNDSALPIVFELVLDSLLLDEALPVQLALPNRVDFPTAVVNSPHHVV